MARGACWFALLLFSLLGSRASAVAPDKPFQQLARDTWSVEQGLPQISVAAVAQDADGYIWAATQQGLARFDGVTFQVYRPEDTPALPGRLISALTRDSSGRLWIGTRQGAAVYEHGRFTAIPLSDRARSNAPLSFWVLQFAELPDHRIVALTSGGLFRGRDTEGLAYWPVLDAERPQSILVTRDTLWVGLTGEVARIAGDETPAHFKLPASAATLPVVALAEHDGALWIGTRGGVFVLELDAVRALPLPMPETDSRVTAMYADAHGNLWIGTEPALVRVRGRTVVEVVSEREIPALSNIAAFCADHEGNLWFGSSLAGLTRVWDSWIERFSRAQGLDDPTAWSVAPWIEDSLLVGVRSGVRVFDHGEFKRPAQFAPIEGRTPYAFFRDRDDLWIGTDRGLFRARPGGALEQMYAAQLGSIEVRSVRRLRDGKLWVATALGPMREAGSRLEPVPVAQPEGARSVRVLVEGPAGEVYLGGPTGAFELRRGVFELLPPSERGRPLPISALLPLPNGDLIAGGQSPALWWRSGGTWHEFGPADGIPANTAGSLVVDRNGWLWVGGMHGLYKLQLSELEAYRAGRIAKLHAEMVLSISGAVPGAQKASCCNSAGSSTAALLGDDLWLPTPDGIVRVPVSGLSRNSVVPPVHIERLRYGGQWREVGTHPPELPSDARDVDIDFTALSFRDPKSVTMKYQLVGYDHDWRTLESALHRRATYTNLPPGPYVFRVIGSNNAGVWNERPAELQFRIAPRFVETWWFFATVMLLTLSVVVAAFRLRTYALTRERRRLERLVADRTSALESANLALLEVSETDTLTKLKNRRFLFERLPSDLTELKVRLVDSEGQAPAYGFLMADLDHFKRINDQYGHEVGDHVLRHVAHVLRATVRSNDYVVRWGGEEFVLVLRDLPRGELARLAESVRRAVADSVFDAGPGVRIPITVSLGGVEYPLFAERPHALDWRQHVELADAAMYQAKSAGRNTWALFRPQPGAAEKLAREVLEGPVADLVASGVMHLDVRPASEVEHSKIAAFPNS